MGEDICELVARHDAAWNAQDLDTIMACYAPDIVFANYNAGESASGSAAVREHLASIFARMAGPALHRPAPVRLRRVLRQRVDGHCDTRRRPAARVGRGRRLPLENGLIARKDVYTTAHAARVLN